MDQFMIDVSHIPDVNIADEVTLIGTDGNETITVEGENISVNVSERCFYVFGSKTLLYTPNNLNPVFKTIDK